MRRHVDSGPVQAWGCDALANLSLDIDLQRILTEAGRYLVLEAMSGHENPDVQQWGCDALVDSPRRRTNALAKAGAIETVISAMHKHTSDAAVPSISRISCIQQRRKSKGNRPGWWGQCHAASCGDCEFEENEDEASNYPMPKTTTTTTTTAFRSGPRKVSASLRATPRCSRGDAVLSSRRRCSAVGLQRTGPSRPHYVCGSSLGHSR